MIARDASHLALDSERWKLVDQLFQQASDLPAPQREPFLRTRCGADAQLLDEVRSLLEAATSDPAFLDWSLPEAAVAAAGEIGAKREGDLIGREVGNYRITRFLAAGGMGAVYEAQQKHPNRTVALKFLRAGWVTPAARRRFEQEAEALARMKHPGVAQIHDAGTIDDAMGPLLYFAMEFVSDARTLIDFARERGSPLEQRVDLFAQVCDAVHHGHQRGIIHRDLKPANILIDAAGQPKIIDFGVARLIDNDIAAPRITRAVTPVIGTLAYMSPEQLHRDALDIDTRSDVYALGVVLYELLTGALPCEVSGKPLSEVMRIIGDRSPAHPATLNRDIDRDLDAITLKALGKRREDRYQSAAELAEDLRRWRRHEPVNAQAPTAMYHLRKWARRHRPLVVGATVALVGLCAGLVGAVWQAAEARQAESDAHKAERIAQSQAQRAEREAQAAMQLSRTLLELIRTSDPTEVDKHFAHPLGQSPQAMVDFCAQLVQQELAAHPLEQARMFESLGVVYANLGRFDQAGAMCERALEVRRREQGPRHADVARSLQSLAWVMHRKGDSALALDLQRQACDIALESVGPDDVLTYQLQFTMRHMFLVAGRYADAEQTARRSLAALDGGLRLADREIVESSLAETLRLQGRFDEACQWFRIAYEHCRDRLGAEHPNTGGALYLLAHASIARGDDDAQLAELFALAREQERLTASLPQNHPHRSGTMLLLGHLQMARGELDAAEQSLRACVAMRTATLTETHRLTAYARNVLGECLLRQGRRDEAEPALRESYEILRRDYGEHAGWTVDARTRLAMLDSNIQE